MELEPLSLHQCLLDSKVSVARRRLLSYSEFWDFIGVFCHLFFGSGSGQDKELDPANVLQERVRVFEPRALSCGSALPQLYGETTTQ